MLLKIYSSSLIQTKICATTTIFRAVLQQGYCQEKSFFFIFYSRLTVSVIKSPQSETFLKEFEKQNTKQKSLAGIVEKALSRQETLKEAVKEKKPKKTLRNLGKAFINMKIFSSTTAQTSSNGDMESLKNNEVQQQDQPEPASDQSTLTKFFSARSSQSLARSQSLYHSLR